MNVASNLTAENSSVFFELNNDGTVLYSRFRQNDQLLNADDDLVGHNFFDEVAGFENAGDLRLLFNSFVQSRKFSDNFDFECRFAEKTVTVRVLMVRGFENKYPNQASFVLLDIRNGND